jgi:hypothetical protein
MLRNFSAHAQPMAALIDTDFWSVRTIVEDGHQYWRTWFRYDGKHDVYPIYVPIYQDAVLTDSYKRTLKDAVHPGAALGLGRQRHRLFR